MWFSSRRALLEKLCCSAEIPMHCWNTPICKRKTSYGKRHVTVVRELWQWGLMRGTCVWRLHRHQLPTKPGKSAPLCCWLSLVLRGQVLWHILQLNAGWWPDMVAILLWVALRVSWEPHLKKNHMTQQSHFWAYTPRKPDLKESRAPQCSSQHCL